MKNDDKDTGVKDDSKVDNKKKQIGLTILNVAVFLVALGLGRLYPVPACIFAAIYFSILLGVTIAKRNAAKQAGENIDMFQKTIVISVAWLVLVVIVLAIQVWSLGGFQPKEGRISVPAHDTAAQAARGVKANMTLPYDVDEVTRLVDVTANGATVQYHYVLHDADTTNLTNQGLEESIRPSVCANTSTKSLLEKDISLQYLYTVENSASTYDFTVSKADCQ